MQEQVQYCKDCKWYSTSSGVSLCCSPSNGIDYITGNPKVMFCHLVRGDSQLCKGFEMKPLLTRPTTEGIKAPSISYENTFLWKYLLGIFKKG